MVLFKNMKQKNQLLLAYFFQFYPDKTGKNWMTIGETLKDVRNAEQKTIIILTFSQKVMVTNALSWLLLFRNMI